MDGYLNYKLHRSGKLRNKKIENEFLSADEQIKRQR